MHQSLNSDRGLQAEGNMPPPTDPAKKSSSGGYFANDEVRWSVRNLVRNQVQTMTFLKERNKHRSQEYVTDVNMTGRQQSQPQVNCSTRNQSGGLSSLDVATASAAQFSNSNTQPSSFWRRLACHNGMCCGMYCGTCCTNITTADIRKRQLSHLLNTRMWQVCLVSCTFLLLFGAPLQILLLPKAADPVMDVLFTMTFCFFWVDMFARMDAEVNYFHCYMCGLVAYSSGIRYHSEQTGAAAPAARSAAQQQQQQQPKTQAYLLPSCCGFQRQPFRFGSFLFFCELMSNLVLLLYITYIATRRFDEETVDIYLDAFGLPEAISGTVNVNTSSPVQFESISLLAIIGKSGRIARFIRSSTAVKISSKVNWFLMLNMINPLWWWERWAQRRRQAIAAANDSPQQQASGTRLDGLVREGSFRKSWGTVVLGAKVKATSLSRHATPDSVGLRGLFTKTRSVLGFQSKSEREEFRRQVAATKIQRAWRARHRHEDGFESRSDEFLDAAWKGRGVATNAKDGEPSSEVQKKGGKWFSGKAGSSSGDASENDKRRSESQVGTAMRELSGQRVAMGIMLALIVTVLFTYTESNSTRPATMVVLHSQTFNSAFSEKALDAARSSSVPDLYSYTFSNGTEQWFNLTGDERPDKLRDHEKIRISVMDVGGSNTTGYFSYRNERQAEALAALLSTIFVLLLWFFGVTSFAGPVMILVVDPIERMVRLLGMLMLDPLGYQSTSRYKRFAAEEAEITKNTHWTEEVLKGMETSFLMSTILRIGSLMKVGFGSAGVEIIRSNLQKGQRNQLMLSSQGSTVSCIFLFSDIRSFTDCTECLQEEVFVFTNKIAAVVHSICHSYGGSANKNIGDAFLLSWLLEEEGDGDGDYGEEGNFVAKDNQADKALLSVVKICVALHHDDYYVDTMSDAARGALIAKLSSRKGPIVQMGFGLHAGKAVQGAIGSTRKIDATYVSEAVERAEFLESSTKKYGLQMLMSDSFHRLLHRNNRRRCRKIDQIIIRSDDEEVDEGFPEGDIVELFTYDMDIGALWNDGKAKDAGRESDMGSDKGSKRMTTSVRQVSGAAMKAGRRRSIKFGKDPASDEMSDVGFLSSVANNAQSETAEVDVGGPGELVLPTGPALYNASVWTKDEDMRKIRQRYIDGLFFHNFNAGLQSFYAKDWDQAKQSFVTILDRFEDGPSRYFLNQIEKHRGKPPRSFLGYGIE